MLVKVSGLAGSSPRMRGAQDRILPRRIPRRIIPADAGSTTAILVSSVCSPDHPRGCGEHASVKFDVLEAPGSSPRMRGALMTAPLVQASGRIIPADAGSTEHQQGPMDGCTDHPRGCGEHRGRHHHMGWA